MLRRFRCNYRGCLIVFNVLKAAWLRHFPCCAYIDGAVGPTGPTGPSGQSAADSVPELLNTSNAAEQASASGAPLNLGARVLAYGTGISYTDNSTSIQLLEAGVYLITFHATVAVQSGASLPAAADVQVYANGGAVDGGATQHIFAAAAERANLAIVVPVAVTSVPESVSVVAAENGLNFSNVAVTVMRVGAVANS